MSKTRSGNELGKIFLVTGIDTGVGKTVATGVMARNLMRRGVDVITMKLVQTGNTGASEDVEAHRALMGDATFEEDAQGLTAPQIFAFPSSPHLAARLEGKEVDTNRIGNALRTLAARHDVVLAEAAGGLAVPLREDLLTVDYAAELDVPIILVSSPKLGSLSHTILALEAAKARRLHVCGVVYNLHCESFDEAIAADTARMVRRHLARLGYPEALVEMPDMAAGGEVPAVDFEAVFGKEVWK